jgi:hypothetical protein
MSSDSSQQQLSGNDDWPARASASIVEQVGRVRDKTTGPALIASRTAVYMAAIGLIAFVLLIVLLLLLFRTLVLVSAWALPFVDPNESWVAHYVLGAIFLGAGVFFWRKKDR